MKAEEILEKNSTFHVRAKMKVDPKDTVWNICPKDALQAMNEFTSHLKEENERLKIEKDRLKRDLKASELVGEQLAEHIKFLTTETESLKKILKETAMRANVCMPESELDEEHFENKFSESGDYLERLFKILKLGEMPPDHKENIIAGEKLDTEILNTVYGMCPKCKENILKCACNLPTWNEIVENAEIKKLRTKLSQLKEDKEAYEGFLTGVRMTLLKFCKTEYVKTEVCRLIADDIKLILNDKAKGDNNE